MTEKLRSEAEIQQEAGHQAGMTRDRQSRREHLDAGASESPLRRPLAAVRHGVAHRDARAR